MINTRCKITKNSIPCNGELKSNWFGTDNGIQLFKSTCLKCKGVIYQENIDYPNLNYNDIVNNRRV